MAEQSKQPLDVNLPPPLKYGENKVEEWQLFKQQFGLYSTISELTERDEKYQTAVFLHSMGSVGLKIYNSLEFTDQENKEEIKTIIKKMDEYIIGNSNETYERYKFNRRNQAEGENIDEYVAALKDLAKSCGFCACVGLKDSLLRDRIVLGVKEDQLRKELLQKRKLSLGEAVDHCRSYEASAQAMQSIVDEKEAVHKIKMKRQYQTLKTKKTCYFCGEIHKLGDRHDCPAWGKKCTKCGRNNHIKSVCGKVPWIKNKQPVHAMEDSYSEDEDEELAYAVSTSHQQNKQDIYAEMIIKGHQEEPTKFQVDCGATINLISRSLIPTARLKPTKKALCMWNNTKERPLGECNLSLKNAKDGKIYKITFIVVADDRKPILGKCTSEKMGLITINYENFRVTNAEGTLMPHRQGFETIHNTCTFLPLDREKVKRRQRMMNRCTRTRTNIFQPLNREKLKRRQGMMNRCIRTLQPMSEVQIAPVTVTEDHTMQKKQEEQEAKRLWGQKEQERLLRVTREKETQKQRKQKEAERLRKQLEAIRCRKQQEEEQLRKQKEAQYNKEDKDLRANKAVGRKEP